jgi:hypothetical protein
MVTLGSIFCGLGSAYSIVATFANHLPIAGALLFLSAVLDCADGQLARMRKTSSLFGRMLDGVADLIVIGATAPATVWLLWRSYASPPWLGATVVALAVVTMVTSSFHTGFYDHYKNVFLKLTADGKDSEDYDAALTRHAALDPRTMTLVGRVSWPIYLYYLKSQRDNVLGFDPYTDTRLTLYPPFDPERAAIYRACAGRAMRLFRSFFGFGSLVFGLSVFVAIGHPEIYLAIRLVVLNAIFYGLLRPEQRRASKEAFEKMGMTLPSKAPDEALAPA